MQQIKESSQEIINKYIRRIDAIRNVLRSPKAIHPQVQEGIIALIVNLLDLLDVKKHPKLKRWVETNKNQTLDDLKLFQTAALNNKINLPYSVCIGLNEAIITFETTTQVEDTTIQINTLLNDGNSESKSEEGVCSKIWACLRKCCPC